MLIFPENTWSRGMPCLARASSRDRSSRAGVEQWA
ncbi:hypothetical protein SAZ_02860 [Streptomyces noursei ZPM]|nr:hypothetical protein SAZ_02860 [Streptomyces noursei ZPM]EPY92223.1 hypothetical protein K530_54430 [Streptomyces noursei CCRC 11814]